MSITTNPMLSMRTKSKEQPKLIWLGIQLADGPSNALQGARGYSPGAYPAASFRIGPVRAPCLRFRHLLCQQVLKPVIFILKNFNAIPWPLNQRAPEEPLCRPDSSSGNEKCREGVDPYKVYSAPDLLPESV